LIAREELGIKESSSCVVAYAFGVKPGSINKLKSRIRLLYSEVPGLMDKYKNLDIKPGISACNETLNEVIMKAEDIGFSKE